MNILYVANIRLPTEKAHGAQILKTCEALAAAGAEIGLAVTDRASAIKSDPFDYYGTRTRFAITRLPVIDTVRWGKFGFILESLSFARAARRLVRRRAPDMVYGRDELVLSCLHKGVPFVWETHTGAWNGAARRAAARAHRIVAISQGLKDFYVEKGIPAEKILVAHDGVDLTAFDLPISKSEAREKLGLGADERIALYTGSTYAWKGVGTLREAESLLPQVQVMVVSGKPFSEIPAYLRAADVLVLPNSGAGAVSSRFTSPMKLFEYMASGTPIAASRVPAVREVLGEDEAYFFTPDDPQSLAGAVRRALDDPGSQAVAAKARRAVQRYSWDTRAQDILRFIGRQ
jgi:glycosyltransferase involved in cell wall biosynthesis